MTQRDRDRLVVLKQVQKRQITQQQAGEQLGYTERHMRRLLKELMSGYIIQLASHSNGWRYRGPERVSPSIELAVLP